MKTDMTEQEQEILIETQPSEHNTKTKKHQRRSGKNPFSSLNAILDGIETDFEDRSHFKKTLFAMLKLRTPICILLAVVLAVTGCWFVIESRNTATTEMSLNY